MTSATKRRRFLAASGAWIAASAVLPALADEEKEHGGKVERGDDTEEVTPPEDLMREHGVLRRILLIYDEVLWRRLAHNEDFPPDVLSGSAQIVRVFVEDYHERLEEQYIFPRFRKAGKSVELVDTLQTQHRAGRVLTDAIQQRANARALKDPGERAKLMAALRLFARMYRPHAAREDTVLFPALRSVVSHHEFDALGDEFEDKEHELFGQDGFEGVVERVAKLEQKLGIYDLAGFTATWTEG
ncbi:MAG TPA: hemerythrin domain-containing protein [Burkholderiales bacterium]|nr:hemerythrin domain-containing protein [Burkholderiales bacterium]